MTFEILAIKSLNNKIHFEPKTKSILNQSQFVKGKHDRFFFIITI